VGLFGVEGCGGKGVGGGGGVSERIWPGGRIKRIK